MPDASGRIRGIAVPRVPWHEDAAMLQAVELLRQGRYGEARDLVGDDFVDGWMHAEDGPG